MPLSDCHGAKILSIFPPESLKLSITKRLKIFKTHQSQIWEKLEGKNSKIVIFEENPRKFFFANERT